MGNRRRLMLLSTLVGMAAVLVASVAIASPGDHRLTNDDGTNGGYVADFKLVNPSSTYTDAVLNACSASHGRQNEPAIAVDPRNTDVIVGSSNDYCGVFNSDGTFVNGIGSVWMGYYRSENGGSTRVSSLIPGY